MKNIGGRISSDLNMYSSKQQGNSELLVFVLKASIWVRCTFKIRQIRRSRASSIALWDGSKRANEQQRIPRQRCITLL